MVWHRLMEENIINGVIILNIMGNITVSCFCCGNKYPVRWFWYICDKCGYRICPSCLGKHSGPCNSNGGVKCSQCYSGILRSKRSAE